MFHVQPECKETSSASTDLSTNHPGPAQALSHWCLNPLTKLPPVPEKFFGRQNMLSRLEENFTHGPCQTIVSLDGMGKSQLAMAYAHRAVRYSFIRWVNAASAQLNGSLRDFAGALGIDMNGLKHDEIIEQVHHHLARLPLGLIIFDNAETKEAIQPYLPTQAHHHVLITSPSQDWPHACLELTDFSQEEAVAYLQNRLAAASEEDCVRLFQILSGLPLLLDHVATYITIHNITIEAYLSQYTSQAQGADADNRLDTVLQLSLNALKTACPGAMEWLYCCAYFQGDAVPSTLLNSLLTEPILSSSSHLTQSVSHYSLIYLFSPDHFTMHPLIQQALIRRDVNKVDHLFTITNKLLELFPAAVEDAESTTRQQQFIPHLEELLEHWIILMERKEGKAVFDIFARLCKTLIHVYQEDLSKKNAIKLKSQAALVQYLPRLAITYPQESARYCNDIGVGLCSQGDFEGAMVLFQTALEGYLCRDGLDDENVTIARGNLAHALYQQHDFIGTINQLRTTLASHSHTLGLNHPNVIKNYIDLGRLLQQQGDLTAALAQFQAALRSSLCAYEPNDPNIGRVYNNIGRVLQDQGCLTEARKHFYTAINIYLCTYQPDHPDVLQVRFNLASVLEGQGDFKRAIEEYRFILDSHLRIHGGPDHLNIVQDRNNLGSALRAQGNWKEAIEQLETALKSRPCIHNPDHLFVSAVRTNLGRALQDKGDLEGAAQQFTAALESDMRIYGKDHPNVATDYNDLGLALQVQGDLEGAMAYFNKALEIDLRTYGPEHFKIARDRGNLGSVLHDQGNVSAALMELEAALQINLRIYGPDHPKVIKDRHRLELARNSRQAEAVADIEAVSEPSSSSAPVPDNNSNHEIRRRENSSVAMARGTLFNPTSSAEGKEDLSARTGRPHYKEQNQQTQIQKRCPAWCPVL